MDVAFDISDELDILQNGQVEVPSTDDDFFMEFSESPSDPAPITVPSAKTRSWTDKAVASFITKMIQRRNQLRVSRPKASVYEDIVNLMKNENFDFTVKCLRDKRRNLQICYADRVKAQDRSWKYYNLMAKFVDGDVFSGDCSVLGTKDQDRAVWCNQATVDLIDAFVTRSQLFEVAHRSRQLWEEIQSEVQEKNPGCTFTWSQCQNKWNTLKAIYFDFQQQLNKSGSDGAVISWPFFDSMSLVISDSVIAEPEYTFSAGVHSEERRRRKLQRNGTQASEKNSTKRRKSDKVSPSTRRLEIMEKNARANARLAKSLNEIVKLNKAKLLSEGFTVPPISDESYSSSD